MKVGAIDIIPLYDGQMVSRAQAAFPAAGTPEFEPHRLYITPDRKRVTHLGAFLVRAGDRLIMVDAGLGPDIGEYRPGSADAALLGAYDQLWRDYGRDETFVRERRDALGEQRVEAGSLGDSLRRAGFEPGDVTDVVATHLHPDHMGWVSRNGEPYFPNAAVWCHEADAAYFLGPSSPDETAFKVMFGVESTKRRMEPVMGHVQTWDRPVVLAPGVETRWLPGHTPGNGAVVVASGGERAIMLGDTVHCALELIDENFSFGADTDPHAAHEAKMTIIREIEDGAVPVASPHFPELRFGRLLRRDAERRWTWEGSEL